VTLDACHDVPIQLGVILQINLAEQSAANDLPDQTKDQVLPAFGDIRRANIHNRASDSLQNKLLNTLKCTMYFLGWCGIYLCRRNDNIVILSDLECVESFLGLGHVQDTGINGLRDGVIDEFTQNQPIWVNTVQ
jgi:hypothetical protein